MNIRVNFNEETQMFEFLFDFCDGKPIQFALNGLETIVLIRELSREKDQKLLRKGHRGVLKLIRGGPC
jgi:hypothetical protein